MISSWIHNAIVFQKRIIRKMLNKEKNFYEVGEMDAGVSKTSNTLKWVLSYKMNKFGKLGNNFLGRNIAPLSNIKLKDQDPDC